MTDEDTVDHKHNEPHMEFLWMGPKGSYPGESEDFATSGGKWGPSGTYGTAGGTVTWSLPAAGLTNQASDTFFTGPTVPFSSIVSFDYVSVIQSAFNAWAAVANIQFQQITDGGGHIGVGTSADIRIVAGYIDGEPAGGSVLARAFLPSFGGSSSQSARAGDVVMDSGQSWTQNLFFLTMLHEIGHSLGLEHSNTTAIMSPIIDTSLTGLTADDIAGIQSIYGNGGPPPADDYANNTSTTGAVAVNGSATGNLEVVGDTDWFRITLSAGADYQFDLEGSPTGQGTLSDPLLRLFNSSGTEVASNDDIVLGVELNSRIEFTAATAGTYYLSAGGFSANNGTYRLSATGPASGPITGDNSNNTLTGTAGDDIMLGLGGNDSLNGLSGADNMSGGTGDDLYYVDNAGDVVVENPGEGLADVIYSTVSYTAAANTEQLYLQGAGNINATGRNGQADILVGNSGNNVLDGKSGIDTMYGGAGNDRFHVDNVGDVVVESAGGGTVDFVYSTVSLTTIANTERLYLEGTGNINATGRDGISDIMIGNSGNNIFDGKSGVDYMYGGAGNDFYYVDSSFDAVVENAGEGSADYIFSTVSHINAANVERLYLQGTGNINATGQNGQNDILTGNSGNNVIDGKGGADFMRGGLGNDFYHVDDAGDTVDEVNGGGGTADIVAASISYAMGDGIERLYLTSTGPGLTFGVGRNDQDDVLVGGAGSNALLGNLGNDLMIGGGGVDYFRFNTALDGVNNVDRIYDFNSADDQFQLEDAIFTGMSAGILSASAFEQGTVANDASDRIIYDSASGAIYYDADGNGAAAQVQFAAVNTGTVLDESDFHIY